jgi:predicted O-linked N-acetylglucosamine transferase (SPINDLY family)
MFGIFRKKKRPVVSAQRVVPLEADRQEQGRAHRLEGNAHLNKGDLAAAAESYEQAVEADPTSVDSRVNLGFALVELERHNEARTHLHQALELDPQSPDALYLLGLTYRKNSEPQTAITAWRQAIALRPDFEACQLQLVQTLQEIGDLATAREVALAGLKTAPGSAQLNHYLASLWAASGQRNQAIETLSKWLSVHPDDGHAVQNLGDALKAEGELGPAIEQYRKAAALNPSSAEVRLRLGSALHESGQLDAAIATYRQALALEPSLAEAHGNIGSALQQKGELKLAIEHYCKAISLKPQFAAAHSNLGNALQEVGDLAGSTRSHRQALALHPNAITHNNLAGVLMTQGLLDEAISEFRTALTLQPGFAPAESNLLFALNYHPEKSAEEIFEAYRAFNLRQSAGSSIVAVHKNERRENRRLRIGYVSPDFRYHPVRHFLEPLLANHDHNVVEVFAYAEGAIEDDVTARYRSYSDHWIPILSLSNEALTQRIRSDGIDVLVDLAGHTGNNRLATFALKPAPVSVSWLGFGYTTGLTAIDYYLTDAASAPPGCEHLFAERPWRLATPCYVYRPGESMGPVSPLPALARGYVTFGTLTRAVRINHRTIRAWSEVLRQVPGSKLVIDSGNFMLAPMRDELAARFLEHGIARDRLLIGFTSPPWDLLRNIDIGFDCFPHNSGTTLFETLFMGLPYVTLAGRPSVGRIGSAILEGVGHSEWIAYSEDEYISKAVALAQDLPRLVALRASLREEMRTSALMDEAGFARKVEGAYREMFSSWLSDQG